MAQSASTIWWLWPPYEIQGWAFDEFVLPEKGFRIKLRGNTLELIFEGQGSFPSSLGQASVEHYIGVLGEYARSTFSLITEQEYVQRTEPPFGNGRLAVFNSGPTRRDGVTIVRDARNAMLDSKYDSLRRCYDFMQATRDASREASAIAVYKAMEVLELHFGGQHRAVALLGRIAKDAKQAANTERHIPERTHSQGTSSGRAVELASQAILKFEKYLIGACYRSP